MLKIFLRTVGAAVVLAGTVVAQVPPIVQPRPAPLQTAPGQIALTAPGPRVLTAPSGDGLRLVALEPSEFTITVSGGMGKNRLTLDAGANTALFSEVQPAPAAVNRTGGTSLVTSQNTPQNALNTASSALQDAKAGAQPLLPAPSTTHTFRFAGFSPSARLPVTLPLTITVTDSEGRSANKALEFQVIPAFKAVSVTAESFLGNGSVAPRGYANLRTDLTFQLDGFENIYEARVKRFSCGGYRQLAIQHSMTRPSGGRWSGKASGAFVSNNSCAGGAFLANLFVEYRFVAGGPLQEQRVLAPEGEFNPRLLPHVSTVVQDTYDWFEERGIATWGPIGSTCSGTSSAIGGGSFPVGFQSRDGDASFEIRSGPLGTTCQFKTVRSIPPHFATRQDGVSLVKLTVKVEGTAKCKGDSPSGVGGAFGLGRLDFMRGIMVNDDDQATHGDISYQPRAGRGDEVIEGVTDAWGPGATGAMWLVENPHMEFALDCAATSTNDHWVRVTITSAEFSHPPGVSVP